MIKTIGDLIKELQKYPSDTLIFDMNGEPFEELIYSKEIYKGDPANPWVEIVEGYILQ